MLAELQRADISGDSPAISRGNACGIGIHDAVAVSDHVEKVTDRRVAQTLFVQRRRLRKTALHDHAVAVASLAVTNGTVNFEAFLAARESLTRDCNGKSGGEILAELAGVKLLVLVQLTARDGVGWRDAGAAVVGEEIIFRERFEVLLIDHAAAAGGEEKKQENGEK